MSLDINWELICRYFFKGWWRLYIICYPFGEKKVLFEHENKKNVIDHLNSLSEMSISSKAAIFHVKDQESIDAFADDAFEFEIEKEKSFTEAMLPVFAISCGIMISIFIYQYFFGK